MTSVWRNMYLHLYQLGELAVSTILELAKEFSPVPRKITLGTKLIQRDSTK